MIVTRPSATHDRAVLFPDGSPSTFTQVAVRIEKSFPFCNFSFLRSLTPRYFARKLTASVVSRSSTSQTSSCARSSLRGREGKTFSLTRVVYQCRTTRENKCTFVLVKKVVVLRGNLGIICYGIRARCDLCFFFLPARHAPIYICLKVPILESRDNGRKGGRPLLFEIQTRI